MPRKTMTAAVNQKKRRFSDGLVTCALLYCVGRWGFWGALLDGPERGVADAD